MKLMFWTSFWPDVGGVETLATKSLSFWAARGHEVLAITASRPGLPELSVFEGVQIQRLPFWSALRKKDPRLIQIIRKRILQIKSDFGPDVLHINFPHYSIYFHLATARQGATPMVLALHRDLGALNTDPDTTLARLVTRASWVVCNSGSTLSSTRHAFPELSGRLSVIHPFADGYNLVPTPPSLCGQTILGIGRLMREKGWDVLIAAFRRIAEEYPQAVLTILGEGPERAALEHQVDELGLGDRVQLPGSVPNRKVFERLNGSIMVVVPSRWREPFGIVAVEAGIMCRPVVATDAGGLEEIVVNQETGLVVDREDPEALVGAMRGILADPARADRMGRAGRLRAQTMFSAESYMAAYEELYQRAAEGRLQAQKEAGIARAK